MLLVTGEVRRIRRGVAKDYTDAEGVKQEWTEDHLLILDRSDDWPTQVRLGRDFDMATLPAVGDEVVLRCWARGLGKSVLFTVEEVVESVPARVSQAG